MDWINALINCGQTVPIPVWLAICFIGWLLSRPAAKRNVKRIHWLEKQKHDKWGRIIYKKKKRRKRRR